MLTTLTVLIALICVLLMGAVLIQNPKGGGVDATFGGAQANQMFGAAKSTDFDYANTVLLMAVKMRNPQAAIMFSEWNGLDSDTHKILMSKVASVGDCAVSGEYTAGKKLVISDINVDATPREQELHRRNLNREHARLVTRLIGGMPVASYYKELEHIGFAIDEI